MASSASANWKNTLTICSMMCGYMGWKLIKKGELETIMPDGITRLKSSILIYSLLKLGSQVQVL